MGPVQIDANFEEPVISILIVPDCDLRYDDSIEGQSCNCTEVGHVESALYTPSRAQGGVASRNRRGPGGGRFGRDCGGRLDAPVAFIAAGREPALNASVLGEFDSAATLFAERTSVARE
jgi:hypothetical protein